MARAFAAFLLLALVLTSALPGDARAQGLRLIVQNSPLAGFRHHEAESVWDRIALGDALELRRDPGNPHDPKAVRVEWRGRMLGFVPRRENSLVAWGLDQGMPMRARVTRLDPHPNPARRIAFEVYLE